jgi:hypothetical protein
MALRAETAARNGQVDRLSVCYNPWDLGDIWVLSPLDNGYIKATAIDTAMKGMTEYQWRVLKRAIRERFEDPEHLLSLAAGRNAIREVVEEALRKPSRRRRVRVARFLSKPALQPDNGDEPSSVPPPPPNLPNDDNNHRTESTDDLGAEATPDLDPDDIDVDDWGVTTT